MNINSEQIDGCEKTSRVYGNMFNMLQEIMEDENKLKDLSPLDFSALGMYIGKFVEQEVNSSVVQIMRAFCGIDMPEYYCKRYPGFDIDADVVCKNKRIRLNEQKDQWNPFSLKTIPLGDAYYALEQLKKEDDEGFFSNYPWLSNQVFLEAWRNLFAFRNRMAHIGEIIDIKALKKNYEFFLRFLIYMPNILETKKELAPEGYAESLSSATDEIEEEKPYFVSTNQRDKPYAPIIIAQRYCELLKSKDIDVDDWLDEINSIIEKYNLDAIIFNSVDGKKGLKDCLGNILVPAIYDGFGFIPRPFDYPRESVIAIRNNNYVLVTMDGSGRELTKEPYEMISLALYNHMYSPYIYRKKGMKSCGFMNVSGEIVCDCIVDRYKWGLNSLWYESGDLQGFWQFNVIFLPPIYDNIEMPGNPDEPLLFTLNGVQGYVRNDDGSFMPLSDFKKLDEDEQHDTLWDYICELYDVF